MLLLQRGQTPKDLAQKSGHMSAVRLLAGPDTYQQNLDAGLGGQVHFVQAMLHMSIHMDPSLFIVPRPTCRLYIKTVGVCQKVP